MTSSHPHVLLSQRLGAITSEERRLEGVAGASIWSASLANLEDIRVNAPEADLIIAGAVEPFDRTALASLPKLSAIVRRGVGYDNVDLQAATDEGIVVANVPDASIEEVSDHAFASLLALERRLFALEHLVRDDAGRTRPAEVQQTRVQSRRFHDLTLGIVGFGRIGAALARKARATYGQVLVYDAVPISPERLDGMVATSFEDLLALSDHVSLHLPLNPSSRHLIGATELAAMRPGSILVNTARGGLIDEAALVKALRAGMPVAAALDVTAQEPLDLLGPLVHPDLADRLLLTGHSAAWSRTAATALAVGSVDAAEAPAHRPPTQIGGEPGCAGLAGPPHTGPVLGAGAAPAVTTTRTATSPQTDQGESL